MSVTLFTGKGAGGAAPGPPGPLGPTAQLLCLCPQNVEALCAAELAALPGVSAVSPRHGAVAFRGTREALYLANLSLRTPSRVLCPLSDWPCRGERDLYDQARELPWEAYLRPRGTLAVSAHGQVPGLENGMFAAQRVKDAICDRFRDRHGVRPDVDTEDPDLAVNVQLYLEDGRPRSALSLDSSGAPLHRRGYRGAGGLAPLKETLAAAILLSAGYGGGTAPPGQGSSRPAGQTIQPGRDPAGTLVDLCCGSGTLLMEGGLLALGRAPGLSRRFGFERWLDHDEALLARIRKELALRARPVDRAAGPFLHGGDIDASALAAARAAGRAAGLEGALELKHKDLREATPPPGAPGLVVCNPPYGERLGDEETLKPLYRALGDTLKRRFAGYRAAVFTGNLRLAREIGLRPERRDILWNGALEGRLLHFSLY